MNKSVHKYSRTVPYEFFLQKLSHCSIDKLFTPEEIELYGKQQQLKSLAARWLIKEILIEHYQQALDFQQISITGLANGQPVISISNSSIVDLIHISISHSRNFIACLVIIEKPCH